MLNTKQITKFKPIKTCRHPSHEPPSHMVYQPGEYEHTCPACGHITNFRVPLIW